MLQQVSKEMSPGARTPAPNLACVRLIAAGGSLQSSSKGLRAGESLWNRAGGEKAANHMLTQASTQQGLA